jgi:hypothetical protein
MTRRRFIAGLGSLAVLLLAAAPALADPADDVAAALRAEGYDNIQIERTLLGRIRITGETADRRREIVIDRGTGEILRDLTEEKSSGLPAGPQGHG